MSSFLPYDPHCAVDFIASWEGFREQAYKCPAGTWTVGYGHTLNVSAGDRVTEEQAKRLMVEDIERVVGRLAPFIYVPVSQNQFVALVSLAFNVGPNYVLTHCHKLMHNLNCGDYEGCADEFLDITRANGKVIKGLVSRRQAEHDLFCG